MLFYFLIYNKKEGKSQPIHAKDDDQRSMFISNDFVHWLTL